MQKNENKKLIEKMANLERRKLFFQNFKMAIKNLLKK